MRPMELIASCAVFVLMVAGAIQLLHVIATGSLR